MVTVLHNQSLFDISIRYTGTIENAFKIAVANGLSLTDELEPGAQLILPEDVEMNNDVVNYFSLAYIPPHHLNALDPFYTMSKPLSIYKQHFACQ